MSFNLMTLLPAMLAILGRGKPKNVETVIKDAIDVISVLPHEELTATIPSIDISEAQRKLMQLGFNPGPVDGWPGEITQAAVKAYQKQHGLEVDGLIGQLTWKSLMG